MHCDSTFNTNTVSSPVFVCGHSDVSGQLHVIALFISSQRRERDAFCMLPSIERECVNSSLLEIDDFMGDADSATKSAVRRLHPKARHLMRFFHDIVSASIAFVPLCVGYD